MKAVKRRESPMLATEKEIRVDTCSKCHSFYTGKLTFAADTGRVAKFRKKLAASEQK